MEGEKEVELGDMVNVIMYELLDFSAV